MKKKMEKLGEKTNLTKGDVKRLTRTGIIGLFVLIFSVLGIKAGGAYAADKNLQPDKDRAKPSSELCTLTPEAGPCKGNFERFYFDAKTKKCTPFYYGGCDGVAPFASYQDCVIACVPAKSENRERMPVKYGAANRRDVKY